MKNNQTGELPEVRWDRLLRIKTAGRDDSSADQYRYPYEPTPYSVLERLAGSGWIRKGNILLDYGCGKGRVGLFLSCQTRCRSIGGCGNLPGPRYTPAADRSAQPGAQSAAHQQRIQKKWVLEIMFQGHQPLTFTYFLV